MWKSSSYSKLSHLGLSLKESLSLSQLLSNSVCFPRGHRECGPRLPPKPALLRSRGSRYPSLVPEVPRPAETCGALQLPEAEESLAESTSPVPSSGDLLIQEAPDSSTSPCATLPSSLEALGRKKEGKVLGKKLKPYTILLKMQLCVLRDRFQRQQYLSLQQMQELSSLLNLSYKQVGPLWLQDRN